MMKVKDPFYSNDHKDGMAPLPQHSGGDILQSLAGVEAIIQSIGDGVVVADERGQLKLFNRAAEELLGIGLTDAPLVDWSKTYGVFLPDGRNLCPAHRLPLARAVRGEHVNGMELVICNRRRKTLNKTAPLRWPARVCNRPS